MVVEAHGRIIETDPEGFLVDLDEWDEQVANAMAAMDDIQLHDAHWEIIRFMRDYYEEFKIIPIMRILAKAICSRLDEEKGSSRYLYSLFPEGPVRQASRYAGLPKPPSCI
ncbi:MAG: TusE/DsrC/DsvC family sulfur relay protein [Gammaproteobacteria bacterium]